MEQPEAEHADLVSARGNSDLPTRKLTYYDFTFNLLIGEGSYGKVFIASLKENGAQFAVKVLEKAHVVRHKKEKQVMAERNLFQRVEHKNIARLLGTFQDNERLYFIMELIRGGSLFDYIQRVGRMPVAEARFIMAELVSVVLYMHDNNIIHRDLKPENVLIDERGHVALVDFGSAKEVSSDDQKGRANTFAGTAQYVAPEVLKGDSVGQSCDMWSLGCILFQMLAAQYPFIGGSEYLVFQAILKCEYTIPADVPAAAADLIRRLLVLEPGERISGNNLRQHEFFGDSGALLAGPSPLRLDQLAVIEIDPDEVDEDVDIELPPPRDDAAASVAPKEPPPSSLVPATEARAFNTGGPAESSSRWSPFLMNGERIVRTSLVRKRKKLLLLRTPPKTRQLILTSFPRLIYVDPTRMIQMGEIPWTAALSAEAESATMFSLSSGSRKYRIEDLDGHAVGWTIEIKKLLQRSATV